MTPQEAETQARELGDKVAVAIYRSNPMTKTRDDLMKIIIKELDLTNLILKANYPSFVGHEKSVEAAKDLAESIIKTIGSGISMELMLDNPFLQQLVRVFVKAGESESFKSFYENTRRAFDASTLENNSLREKLELAEGAKDETLLKLVNTQSFARECQQAARKLEEQLLIAQADCAVKFEALKQVVEWFNAQSTLMPDKIYIPIQNALSTNPGQSLLDRLHKDELTTRLDEASYQKLLDELKLAKEKADALDWLENNQLVPCWPKEPDNLYRLWYEYGEYTGKTLLQAIKSCQE